MKYNKADESIRNIIETYRNGELILSPSFQRGYVWNITQASRLIESVLLSIPLPSVYLYETNFDRDSDKTIREVIDGKQRLTTLIFFVLNKSPFSSLSTKKFKLVSKYKELNGKTFEQLDGELKKKIYATKIRTTEIPHDIDASLKYSLFERINVGSVALNSQEIRNCVSRGQFNDWLNEVVNSKICKTLMGDENKSPRMERQEALLKICLFQASWNGLGEFPIHTKTHLDIFMRNHAKLSEKELEYVTKPLLSSLRKVNHIFGAHFFTNSRKTFDSRALVYVTAWVYLNNDLVLDNGVADAINDALREAKMQKAYLSACIKTKGEFIFDCLNSAIDSDFVKKDSVRFFSRKFALKLYNSSKTKQCEICNNSIHHFDDCQVDHRIAWSNGGRTTSANAQLSHSLCNQQKSNKD